MLLLCMCAGATFTTSARAGSQRLLPSGVTSAPSFGQASDTHTCCQLRVSCTRQVSTLVQSSYPGIVFGLQQTRQFGEEDLSYGLFGRLTMELQF